MIEGHTVYVGLGSNLGRRLENLRNALRQLDETDGVRVETVSPVYESQAHTKGRDEGIPDFLNLVARISTRLSAVDLLDTCLAIEATAGRHRVDGTWQPRTIDIDILAFANQVLDSERLKVPHPRMAKRRFVLLPFADLAPDFSLPEPISATVLQLLNDCSDTLRIERRYPADAVFSFGDRPR